MGAVEERGRVFHHLASQLVSTSSKTPQAERLEELFDATRAFIEQVGPDAVALEGQYFHRQREVAFKVGQAVGVCVLAAAQLEVPVHEYGPMQVSCSYSDI